MQTHLMADSETIRQLFREAVARWPGYFYGALEPVNGLTHVLRIGGREVWLPPEIWNDVIGGMRHPLAPGIQVILQTWPHPDGGATWLFYVVVRDTGAVGVRRFGPGQPQTARVDARFRHTRTTALDLAKQFVTQPF